MRGFGVVISRLRLVFEVYSDDCSRLYGLQAAFLVGEEVLFLFGVRELTMLVVAFV